MKPSGNRSNRSNGRAQHSSPPFARHIGRNYNNKKSNKLYNIMDKIKDKALTTLDKVDKDFSYQLFRQSQMLGSRFRQLLVTLEWSCHGLLWFAGVVILIFYNQQSTALAHLLIGLFMDVIYVAVIKALARRRRPTYANQRDQYMMVAMDKHSFPSGHCTRAVYIACFVQNLIADSSQLSLLALAVNLWAFSVSASRVALGRHHIFDCLAGVAIGATEYWIQFSTFLPINFIGVFVLRSLIGNKAFSNSNDMDDITYDGP